MTVELLLIIHEMKAITKLISKSWIVWILNQYPCIFIIPKILFHEYSAEEVS